MIGSTGEEVSQGESKEVGVGATAGARVVLGDIVGATARVRVSLAMDEEVGVILGATGARVVQGEALSLSESEDIGVLVGDPQGARGGGWCFITRVCRGSPDGRG